MNREFKVMDDTEGIFSSMPEWYTWENMKKAMERKETFKKKLEEQLTKQKQLNMFLAKEASN